eukprot:TRINITY_DN2667_c0_g1_i1.p2 TRINITY_DN2667_c0_g1~~TRINITY_DN2667_c0_g1_i1.p2  ORF type:complete len:189 (-),score=77.86 TRINITY_DN2667_c0_g1_i1:148-714(-)
MSEEGEDKFVVEAILGQKKVKGQKMYHIKWEGYEETTWEPAKAMKQDVPDLVKEFEGAMGKKRKSSVGMEVRGSIGSATKRDRKATSEVATTPSAERSRKRMKASELVDVVEESVSSKVATCRKADGSLLYRVVWTMKNDEEHETWETSERMREINPVALVEFLESRIRFPDAKKKEEPKKEEPKKDE